MVLPIEHLSKSITLVRYTSLTDILLKTKVGSSPLSNLRVCVFRDKPKDILAKLRNAKVGIGSENLSESTFVLRSLVIDRIQGVVE